MVKRRLATLARRLERPYDVHNRVEVSQSALLHNAAWFGHATELTIIPVLKGNAYGHGIEQVARALRSDHFPYVAVDGYFEASQVHAGNPRQPVLVMGMIKPANVAKLSLHNLAFVVQDRATIEALARRRNTVKIHLEVNTGMNRYGVPIAELDDYLDLIAAHPRLKLEGVMSHLADSDGLASATVTSAVAQFDQVVEHVLARGLQPKWLHLAQTAGSLRPNSRYANALRLGVGLYGLNPFPANHPLYSAFLQLRPSLRLISTITKIHQLAPGDKVGYNYTFTAKHAMRLGVLPIGYHEGVNLALSNKGVVKFGQQFLPIAGLVCMNHMMIDLVDSPASEGDEIVVYSDQTTDRNSLMSIARQFDLPPRLLLTSISPDVRRCLVD